MQCLLTVTFQELLSQRAMHAMAVTGQSPCNVTRGMYAYAAVRHALPSDLHADA